MSRHALAALAAALVGCAAAPTPPEARRVVVVPAEWEQVVEENAAAPAVLVRDCHWRGQCIGVQGTGSDPAFDRGWLGDELTDVVVMDGPWCHGYSVGVFSYTWEGVSLAVRVVAETLAEHDSSALVPVCIHYPSVYL